MAAVEAAAAAAKDVQTVQPERAIRSLRPRPLPAFPPLALPFALAWRAASVAAIAALALLLADVADAPSSSSACRRLYVCLCRQSR